MANELTINLNSITFIKGIHNDTLAPNAPFTLTVAGQYAVHDSQQLSTTPAAIAKGNIGTVGFFFIKNLDASINVLISVGSTDYFVILPGMIAIGYANASAVNAKSASGTPKIEYWLVEA